MILNWWFQICFKSLRLIWMLGRYGRCGSSPVFPTLFTMHWRLLKLLQFPITGWFLSLLTIFNGLVPHHLVSFHEQHNFLNYFSSNIQGSYSSSGLFHQIICLILFAICVVIWAWAGSNQLDHTVPPFASMEYNPPDRDTCLILAKSSEEAPDLHPLKFNLSSVINLFSANDYQNICSCPVNFSFLLLKLTSPVDWWKRDSAAHSAL